MYPERTPSGRTVRAHDRTDGDSPGVHFISDGSITDVYFEVRRRRGSTPEAEQARFRGEVERRADYVDASEPLETTAGGREACAFSFRLSDRERAAIFVADGADAYRIIYDPRSPINVTMLSTIEFVEESE